jgi:hypothetical protein
MRRERQSPITSNDRDKNIRLPENTRDFKFTKIKCSRERPGFPVELDPENVHVSVDTHDAFRDTYQTHNEGDM